MNNLMNFIRLHKNWRDLLSNSPFNLIIKDDEDYSDVYLFKYNQYESDMNNIICQEARGIILEIKEIYDTERQVRLLCHSFDKFFNHCEPQGLQVLDEFNWCDYSFQEKRDGSLLRMWYYNDKWNVSTSGTIDAFKASIDIPSCPYSSFGQMFKETYDSYNENVELDDGITYSFELTSPDNKIVVDYDKNELTLIGMRCNYINEEVDPIYNNPFKNIKVAKRFQYISLKDALNHINKFKNFEGLVLCDSDFRRVKIKTEEYLILAKLYDVMSSDKNILSLILEDKIDDIKGQVSEHSLKRIEHVENYIKTELDNIHSLFNSIDFTLDKKSIALQLKGNKYAFHVFNKIKDPTYEPSSYFNINNLPFIYKDYKASSSLSG